MRSDSRSQCLSQLSIWPLIVAHPEVMFNVILAEVTQKCKSWEVCMMKVGRKSWFM